ncbi:DUF4255 domain-containing protein [Pseudofrankia inefficax]|uniref:Pvc16 N-terminal domain-containing protein n=1 Tax=Pseudofrankia inefficax (strain DSM 45817 / CECT 9037 / DDB 130130 / EuI1c) TaxID=298654 RepID=E3IXB0_PSEI1|nr:DUF4255 domain-containing protein [Pseudofrankia inefficax]ADP85010.1 hypothetical protein FraEuI1c_7044 [Pseudofrankia inefficax]
MFHDLDTSLAALVRAELALPGVDISFDGPDDQFPPSQVHLPALSFFLYDIREDVELRPSDWDVDQDATGAYIRRRPPKRVACSYLITAWPSDHTPHPSQDEHQMLGEVLKVLLRHPTIPAEYLANELAGQQPPVPTRIIAENRLQSLGEFWQAMGGKPKAALHFGVTLSFDVFAPSEPTPEVKRLDVVVGNQVPPPKTPTAPPATPPTETPTETPAETATPPAT